AVLREIFRALEALRQFLTDGLLNYARTGEAYQRARLGDLHITEHRVRGGDAAGGRIGEHNDVRLARFAQHLHTDRRTRELHQGQYPFLHARTAGRREHDEWCLPAHRSLEAGDHRLTGRHAERTAHEVEILNGDRDHLAFQPSDAELHRVLQSGSGAGVLEAVGVAALIAKLERIERHLRQDDIFKLTAVEHGLQPLRGADAHVIVRAWNDELVGLNVLVKNELPGLRTFDPEIFRRLAAQEAADFRPDDVGDPVHGSSI